MKKVLTVLAGMLFVSVNYGQSNRKPVPVKDRPEVQNAKLKSGRNSSASVASASDSEYYGLDAKIKELMISGKIPADFPKAVNSASRQEFIEAANTWLSKNQFYIKPELQKSILE